MLHTTVGGGGDARSNRWRRQGKGRVSAAERVEVPAAGQNAIVLEEKNRRRMSYAPKCLLKLKSLRTLYEKRKHLSKSVIHSRRVEESFTRRGYRPETKKREVFFCRKPGEIPC